MDCRSDQSLTVSYFFSNFLEISFSGFFLEREIIANALVYNMLFIFLQFFHFLV